VTHLRLRLEESTKSSASDSKLRGRTAGIWGRRNVAHGGIVAVPPLDLSVDKVANEHAVLRVNDVAVCEGEVRRRRRRASKRS
jgi:hypothetical protein